MGVRMLERGLYQNAYLTLRASVACMNRFINLCHEDILDYEDEIRFATTIHRELQCARERLLQEDLISPPLALSIETVSYEGPFNHESMMESLWKTKSCPISIRIDALPTFPDDRTNLDLESAIILYNFGVSHFCLSTQMKDGRNVPEWQCTFDLFEMAYEMVAGESTGFWDFNTICPASLPLFLARALVGAHSLQSRATALEIAGNTNEAIKAKQSLQKILMVVDELEESSESSVDSIAASAA